MSRRIRTATGSDGANASVEPTSSHPDTAFVAGLLAAHGHDGANAPTVNRTNSDQGTAEPDPQPAPRETLDLTHRNDVGLADAVEARQVADSDTDEIRARRRAYLVTLGTRLDEARIERLRPALIDKILTVPGNSEESERHRWIVLAHYADWFERTTGRDFDPDRHLDDTLVDDYLRTRTDLNHGSRTNHRHTIAKIRDGYRLKPANVEHTRKAPYNRAQRDQFFTAARALTDQTWRQIVLIALYLTFHAGLHDREIVGLRGTDITITGNGVDLIVRGRARDRVIPVFGAAATHLAQFAGDDEWVYWPRFRKRRPNALPHMRYNVGAIDDLFATFDHRAARKQYVMELMARPIPMNTVLYVANASMNDHMPQSLYAWIERPTPAEVRRWLAQALTAAPL